jgi:hypothetical protein
VNRPFSASPSADQLPGKSRKTGLLLALLGTGSFPFRSEAVVSFRPKQKALSFNRASPRLPILGEFVPQVF